MSGIIDEEKKECEESSMPIKEGSDSKATPQDRSETAPGEAPATLTPSLPEVNPSGLLVGVITVLYVIFLLAVGAGVIALCLFLYGKIWSWIH
ncbi:MAG: hypothetical protein J6Y08_07570 [Clostridiales bacterium]|nr:hypothetical protein [Clostridiales bacterium]